MEKGYVSMVLHAHLPYIRHPESQNYLEEYWLYEAMNETYLPLIDVFERLSEEDVSFKISFTFTPTLLSMLSDPLLIDRFESYLHLRIELARKEIQRTKNIYQLSEVPKMYLKKFKRNLAIFRKYKRNVIDAFKKYYESGNIEILASAATHGYLPLMDVIPEAVYAQLKLGVDTHKKYFGKPPQGIWLPECGYSQTIDPILENLGIRYFIVENHGIQYADPRPLHGVYQPICTPRGIAAFGRDMESSKQVWSSQEGYPGDYDYREFYRDIGYELEMDYLKPYLLPNGTRFDTGLKYHRITGCHQDKAVYIPENALDKAAIHAGNFMFNRKNQIEYLSQSMDTPPIVLCPYDAELFGHWWYEGPDWLYFLMKKTHYNQNTYKMVTPIEYLQRHPVLQLAQPCPSSWGYRGYNEVWINPANDWIYPHLHEMADRMKNMANRYRNVQGNYLRALNQAARELLLAQSSDWAFIMKTGTMAPYAKYRTQVHIHRFNILFEQIKHHSLDLSWLEWIESMDNIFPDLHFSVYDSRNVWQFQYNVSS